MDKPAFIQMSVFIDGTAFQLSGVAQRYGAPANLVKSQIFSWPTGPLGAA
jgi:hypothetical protein